MFHPSAAEFENPMEYILSIRETAERFGICWCSAPAPGSAPAAPCFASRLAFTSGSIVPPPSWNPPFMLDRNKLKFPTRVQKINELMASHARLPTMPVDRSSARLHRLQLPTAASRVCDARAGTQGAPHAVHEGPHRVLGQSGLAALQDAGHRWH